MVNNKVELVMTMYHAVEFKDVDINQKFIIPGAERNYKLLKLNDTAYSIIEEEKVINDVPQDLVVWAIIKD